MTGVFAKRPDAKAALFLRYAKSITGVSMRTLAIWLFSALLAAVTLSPPSLALADETKITDEAQRVFEDYGDALYQVQVIDTKATGKKTSIGSGFQFTADGLIATNYHVVAEAVQRQSNHRLEYIHDKGEKGSLKLLMADVGHDLAILQMDKPGQSFVELGRSDLPKGARLFSMGNPHDIGFTIIEGTYNGVNHDSFIDKIHFSGSLNPGMSGGPALGHDGKVVGVNVSTAGNAISFLVPVEPLRDLLAEYKKQPAGYDFMAHASDYIQDRLLQVQDRNVKRILSQKWESKPFGPFLVPDRIDLAFKCWGGSDDQEKNPYTTYLSTCSSQDRLFLDEDFDTGTYLYRYDYIVGKPRLNRLRFYNYYESRYSLPLEASSNAGEENVTNFDCNDSFVDAAGSRWKTSFCVRQYKKYRKLYDMQLYMALVGDGTQGVMVSAAAAGVSRENAVKLAQRFMTELKPLPAGAVTPPDLPPMKTTPAAQGEAPKGPAAAAPSASKDDSDNSDDAPDADDKDNSAKDNGDKDRGDAPEGDKP